jgi:hypothetical protein
VKEGCDVHVGVLCALNTRVRGRHVRHAVETGGEGKSSHLSVCNDAVEHIVQRLACDLPEITAVKARGGGSPQRLYPGSVVRGVARLALEFDYFHTACQFRLAICTSRIYDVHFLQIVLLEQIVGEF